MNWTTWKRNWGVLTKRKEAMKFYLMIMPKKWKKYNSILESTTQAPKTFPATHSYPNHQMSIRTASSENHSFLPASSSEIAAIIVIWVNIHIPKKITVLWRKRREASSKLSTIGVWEIARWNRKIGSWKIADFCLILLELCFSIGNAIKIELIDSYYRRI